MILGHGSRQARPLESPEHSSEALKHRKILEDLRAFGRTEIRSSIFVKEDGKTFLHFLFCEHEEAEQTFFQLESLQAWRAALVESHPKGKLPTPTRLIVVGSTAKLP